MAYTQAQLQAQLANAQKRLDPNSVTGQATINRINSQLNALKTPTTVTAPSATAPIVKTPTTVTTPTVKTPTAVTAPVVKTTSTPTVKTVTTPKVNSQGYTNNISANSAIADATYGGVPKVNTTVNNVTPKIDTNTVAQIAPSTVTPKTTLRDFTASMGTPIGYDAATGNVSIGNMAITPQQLQQYGLYNDNGRWTGTQDQIGALVAATQGKDVGVRQYFENLGQPVRFENGQLYVSDVPVNMSGLTNIGGRLYGSQEDIQRIVNATGGSVPLGQEYSNIEQEQYSQENAFQTQMDEINQDANFKIEELQQQNEEIQNQLDEYMQQANQQQLSLVEGLKNYQDEYKGYFSQILGEIMKPFGYDPNTDAGLQDAYKYADAKIQADLIRRGMDDSSLSASSKVQLMKELMPQYQNLALEKYNNNISRLIQTGNFVQSLGKEAYDRFSAYTSAAINATDKINASTIKSFEKVIDSIKDQQTSTINQAKNQIEATNKAYEAALDKLDKFGYVTTDIAPILGLPAGTPSAQARKDIIDRTDKFTLKQIDLDNELSKTQILAQQKKDEAKELARVKNKTNSIISQLSTMDPNKAIMYVAENADALLESGVDIEAINKALFERKKESTDTYYKQRADARDESRLTIDRQRETRLASESKESKKPQTIEEKLKAGLTLNEAEMKQAYNQDYAEIKAMSYSDAYDYLKENRSSISRLYGPAGYKQLYNDVLEDVIKQNKDAEKNKTTTPWSYIKPFEIEEG